MQVNDTREELRSNLVLWKKRMLNKIERIYEKLLVDVENSFEEITDDLESKKKDLAHLFEETVSNKLERLSSKLDFYPHELNELRLSLNDIYHRIHDARTSLIDIDYGSGNTYLLENDNSFESPKIIIQTKVDIEKILNGSSLRQFHIDIEHPSNLLYDTSPKHVREFCREEFEEIEYFSYSFAIMKIILCNYSIKNNELVEHFGQKIRRQLHRLNGHPISIDFFFFVLNLSLLLTVQLNLSTSIQFLKYVSHLSLFSNKFSFRFNRKKVIQ